MILYDCGIIWYQSDSHSRLHLDNVFRIRFCKDLSKKKYELNTLSLSLSQCKGKGAKIRIIFNQEYMYVRFLCKLQIYGKTCLKIYADFLKKLLKCKSNTSLSCTLVQVT